jgi:hypothetical protein
MMSSFNARLRLPGRSRLPLGVGVDISHERMTLTAGDRTVAAWPLEVLEVSSLSDGFHIKVDGDDFVLDVSDSTRFAAELGIGERPRRLAVAGAGQRAHSELSSAYSHQNSFRTNGKIISPRPIADARRAEGNLDDVQRRISDIAEALTSDSVSPAAAFAHWLGLLKEINRRHGQGSMPTDLYYRLNTQLLDLIPEPAPIPA